MKIPTYALILAAAASGHALGAATAYTTPVGYITSSIAGAGSKPSADSYISASLVEATAFAGVTNAAPSAKTITFAGASVPTTLDGTYVLEITSGASEGWWSTVTSSTSSTIVVNDNFPIGLASGLTISVRKHSTLKTYLGANVPGLIPFDGTSANDEVQILNPITQSVTAFAYVPASISGAAQDGWFDLGASTNADGYVIEPGSSIKIKRVGATALTFVSSGTVKTTKTQVDLFTKYNWIGTPMAAGNTLNGMLFNTQLIPFNGANPNYDELQFVNANQTVTAYAALDVSLGLGQTMGDLGTSADAGSIVFPQGYGAILKRIGSAPSIITIPGTVVAP